MDAEHEAHLDSILLEAHGLISAKYRAGQAEHGGNLWSKPGLLDEAIKEVVDLLVYLLTERQRQAAHHTPVITPGTSEK